MNKKLKLRTQTRLHKKFFIPAIMFLLTTSSLVWAKDKKSSQEIPYLSKTEKIRLINEKFENQIEMFLNAKIKGNSLVLLKEAPLPKPSNEKSNSKNQPSPNELIRVKIPTDSVVTGISCKGIRDFLKNEGLQEFLEKHDQEGRSEGNSKAKITRETLKTYFEDEHLTHHFSKRTLKILKDDLIEQVKNALLLRRLPQVCFADIKEPANEKHTVYLNHAIIDNQTSDYSPEYELIDFTYDENYISNLDSPTIPTEKE
jgi:hypothetical protein